MLKSFELAEKSGALGELKATRKFLDKFADRLPKQPEPLLNSDGSQVVDDQGALVFKPTE